jgi:hypothetical protein
MRRAHQRTPRHADPPLHTLAPDPTRCPTCAYLRHEHDDWCPDRGPVGDDEKGKSCPWPLAGGDLVWVEQGEMYGALIDFARRDGRWYLLTTSQGRCVAPLKILFYRRPTR